MRKLFYVFFTLLCLMLICPLFASETQDPIITIFNSLVELIRNPKGLGVLGCISLSITIIISITKLDFMGNLFQKLNPYIQRALVVVLGQISGILIAVIGGVVWYEAIIAGLLSSGGAIAIYEVIKPFFKKK